MTAWPRCRTWEARLCRLDRDGTETDSSSFFFRLLSWANCGGGRTGHGDGRDGGGGDLGSPSARGLAVVDGNQAIHKNIFLILQA